MRQVLACCGIAGVLFSAVPAWKAGNTSAATVSISGSGLEMETHVPAWVYWPAGGRIETAKVEKNVATGGFSGVVQITLSGELPAAEADFIQNLGTAGYTVRKIQLPADAFFGAYSVIEATDDRAHRRINIVLRNEPWSESARIFFIEEPKPVSADRSA